MSVIAGLAKATAGAKLLTGMRPTRRFLPKTKWTLLVMAVALFALVTFAALVPASQAPSTEPYSSVGSNDSKSGAAAPVSEPGTAPKMSEEEALDAYGKLPLSFIPNEGQTDKAMRYFAQGAGYGFFFSKEGATLSFAEGKGRGHALSLDFQGADPHATLTARQRLTGKVNYLAGDDPTKWQQGLSPHGELLYGGLWPGIDMAVRGEEGKLKYEFHLKPGSSVGDVRLGYRGAEGLSVGSGGELLVQTSLGILKDAAPVSYQRIGGERVPVESRYELKGDGGYGFAVGAHDPRYPLIIDPGLDYSTFLGDTDSDAGLDIAVREGNAYVTGFTASTDYPTTASAYDSSFNGGFTDAFVTKLNASGSELIYSTFLGGTDQDDGRGIAVDGSGSAYVTGSAQSANFPTTASAFNTSFNGATDTFVTKLNASGSALVYSTFLGGTNFDDGSDIAVREGRAYVTGQTQSADYPTTSGAYDTSFNGGFNDAFVSKLNASGSALDYSTFLGGTGGMRKRDEGRGIAVDRGGSAYVTGLTQSADYPTTPGAFDRTFMGGPTGGNFDAFATKLNASGSALDYSTFLGGTTEDIGNGIAVDGRGRAYVTGYTRSADYPTTRGAFDTSRTRDDAFVTKLTASGSKLAYSTFLGGTSVDQGEAIAVDGEDRAYVTGPTQSADYPTTPSAFDTTFHGTFNGTEDTFVTKLPTG
jgi:Beta-propeller repeat